MLCEPNKALLRGAPLHGIWFTGQSASSKILNKWGPPVNPSMKTRILWTGTLLFVTWRFPFLDGYSPLALPDPLSPLLTLLCTSGGYPPQTNFFVLFPWGSLGSSNGMACKKLRGRKRGSLAYVIPWLLPWHARLQWLQYSPKGHSSHQVALSYS